MVIRFKTSLVVSVHIFIATIASATPLSLKKSIELTFQNNPRFLTFLSQTKSLESDIKQNLGLYDWQTSLSFNYLDADQARESVFQPSNIKETSYGLDISKRFGLGTTVGLGSGITRSEDDSTFSLINRRYQSSVSLSLEQPLLDGFVGGPERVRLKTNEMRRSSLNHLLWRQMELLAFEVSERYWELWRENQLLIVAIDSEEEARDFLEETKRLKKLGLREEDDVLLAEASLLGRKEERLLTATRLGNLWKSFQIFLGMKNHAEGIPKLDDPSWTDIPAEGELLKQAFRKRADFLASELNKEINNQLGESLKGNLLPQLNASGGYSLTGLDPDLNESVNEIEDFKVRGWNVGISLSHSFGQNNDRSEIELAESQKLSAEATYDQTVDNLKSEIYSTMQVFNVNRELLKLARVVEQKRKKIEEIFRKKFGQGRVSIQDFLRAKEDYRQARYRRRLAESTMTVSYFDVLKAQGEFLESRGFENRDPLTLLQREVP